MRPSTLQVTTKLQMSRRLQMLTNVFGTFLDHFQGMFSGGLTLFECFWSTFTHFGTILELFWNHSQIIFRSVRFASFSFSFRFIFVLFRYSFSFGSCFCFDFRFISFLRPIVLFSAKGHVAASRQRRFIPDVAASVRVEITLRGIDLIFPFSENWPANYNFSLFSKLPTNYPQSKKHSKNNLFFPKMRGLPRIFDCFLNIFLFGG